MSSTHLRPKDYIASGEFSSISVPRVRLSDLELAVFGYVASHDTLKDGPPDSPEWVSYRLTYELIFEYLKEKEIGRVRNLLLQYIARAESVGAKELAKSFNGLYEKTQKGQDFGYDEFHPKVLARIYRQDPFLTSSQASIKRLADKRILESVRGHGTRYLRLRIRRGVKRITS